MSTEPRPRARFSLDRRILAVIAVAIVAYVIVRGHVLSRSALLLLAVLFPSVILHEVSHGAVAYLFGDPTAKESGRLTLNPIRHVDPFGTIILPAMLVLAGAPAFGYAKPVPVNVRRLRNPRNHSLLVSLAGPATNILLVAVSTAALLTVATPTEIHVFRLGFMTGRLLPDLLLSAALINILLAVFNMIPLPPLDGSAIVERMLPARWWPGWLKLRQYSMGILLLLFLVVPAKYGLSRIMEPAVRFWANTFLT